MALLLNEEKSIFFSFFKFSLGSLNNILVLASNLGWITAVLIKPIIIVKIKR